MKTSRLTREDEGFENKENTNLATRALLYELSRGTSVVMTIPRFQLACNNIFFSFFFLLLCSVKWSLFCVSCDFVLCSSYLCKSVIFVIGSSDQRLD